MGRPKKYKPQRYVLSDLHGNYKALREVMKDFNYEKDELIVLGDICDGYNKTYECVELLLKVKNLTVVKGNHDCIDVNTEVLTDGGWVVAKDVVGEKLANFDIDSGVISYDYPLNKVPVHNSDGIIIEGYNSMQHVTPNHDIIINNKKIKAKDVDEGICSNNFRHFGYVNNNGIDMSDDYIRLLTWVICDGCMYSSSGFSKRVQFKLSKERKIERLKNLLDTLNIKYTFKKATKGETNKLQPYMIRMYGNQARSIFKLLNNKKEVPEYFLNMNLEQVNVFLEELKLTDGYVDEWGKTSLATINKDDADRIQIMMITNGISCKVNEIKIGSGFKNGKQQYQITIYKGIAKKEKIRISETKDCKFMCFTMPKGTLITRLNGKVAFTGNCWFIDWFTKGLEPGIWLSQGGENTVYSYKWRGYEAHRIPQEHKDLFLKAVNFHEVDKMLFVHGGINYPEHPVSTEQNFLLWDRTLIDRFANKLQVKEWDKIFIGHTSTEREGEKPVRYDVEGFASLIRVDCGAGWKGKLCLYNIDTDEYILSEHCLGCNR